ncbi:hypothetical protein Mgra_00002181 [Meloidogyne graminicola]|uniref:Uncharacterized protein n=1 Tax=Meloidogyne graminicola TaxID=189291 RepID=A0A8T0A022_9BILA|nr:hypothetical protein Mgra_00002181 [Meloidogyne graminicola]
MTLLYVDLDKMKVLLFNDTITHLFLKRRKISFESKIKFLYKYAEILSYFYSLEICQRTLIRFV